MAWTCSASSNNLLVEKLRTANIVTSDCVAQAMKRIDRANFLPPDAPPNVAYKDSPQPLGLGQTISAPHMHAFALERAAIALEGVRAPRVLDVGAGSGYLTACLGRLVERAGGTVFGIERLPALVDMATRNVQRGDQDLFSRGVVSIKQADGWHGLPDEGPFHFIHVGAAAEEVPRKLLDQLAESGSLLIPVGRQGDVQEMLSFRRNGQEFAREELMRVGYVPLVRE